MKTIAIAKNHFSLHPSGAAYWQEKKTLLLADVHLGKVAHFRKNGIVVPWKAESAFYKKMESLFQTFAIERILFLGDLFHSDQNNAWHLFAAWVEQQKAELVLVEGNHDVIPSWKFEQLGLKVVESLTEEAFFFTHFPTAHDSRFVFCGHIHPGVKLKGAGLQRLSLPCFYQSQNQLILPAFGAFTGLHLLQAKEGDRVFVATGKEVVEFGEKMH